MSSLRIVSQQRSSGLSNGSTGLIMLGLGTEYMCAMAYYTHGSTLWPDNPFLTSLTGWRMKNVHYEPGEALSVDDFVVKP